MQVDKAEKKIGKLSEQHFIHNRWSCRIRTFPILKKVQIIIIIIVIVIIIIIPSYYSGCFRQDEAFQNDWETSWLFHSYILSTDKMVKFIN